MKQTTPSPADVYDAVVVVHVCFHARSHVTTHSYSVRHPVRLHVAGTVAGQINTATAFTVATYGNKVVLGTHKSKTTQPTPLHHSV